MTRIATPLIAGNWKLNHGPTETRAYLDAFLPLVSAARGSGTIALFPPALSVSTAREVLAGREDILLGVQNVHWEAAGAFTGEISAPMAFDAGASLALVGHSERRQLFGETDDHTTRKVLAVLAAGLTPVLCVGETLEMREIGREREVVSRQLNAVIDHIEPRHLDTFVIAYEPVWAIGTGRTATPAHASEMHTHIRQVMASRFGEDGARVPILYGGSVKPSNAMELLAVPAVDGLLVGGASLDPASFASICAAHP